MDSYGMALSTTRDGADIFIYENPVLAPVKVRFLACLKGAAIGNPDYVRSNRSSGICIAFKAAMATHRVVTVTDNFLRFHPVLSQSIVNLLPEFPNWKLRSVADIRTMLEGLPVRRLPARQREVVAFITEDDPSGEETTEQPKRAPMLAPRARLLASVKRLPATNVHDVGSESEPEPACNTHAQLFARPLPFSSSACPPTHPHTHPSATPDTPTQLAPATCCVALHSICFTSQELELVLHKITVANCFSKELFCKYDIKRCMSGFCGM